MDPTFVLQTILAFVALKRFLGHDEVVLFAVSCMWSAKITVLNMKTLQEYRIWHDRMMEEADIVITYNRSNHFNAAGKKFWCF